MNEVFPQVSIVSLADAASGSAVLIPRAGGTFLALASAEATAGIGRCAVILSGPAGRGPYPWYADLTNVNRCLCYGTDLRWELNAIQSDPEGREFWETPGAIVVVEDRLYLRAALKNNMYRSYLFVDIVSGSLLSGATPNELWTILAWELWLKHPNPGRDLKLHEFRCDSAGGRV